MGEVTVEPEAKDLEIAPSVQLNASKFDAIIQFSQQTEKIGRALDNIRNFVLGRAFPGDWVRFGDKLEMSGPAAERAMSSLALMGISVSFTGWKYWKDSGTDKNGEWFTWWYEADVDIAGLHVEKVQGRAGSRDKFFGYEDGAFKDLGDVKESDIRMAARRGVIKEGIKMGMGLRSVPFEHAAKLGLDPSKIKAVAFGGRGETKVDAAAPGTPVKIVSVERFKGTNKKTGKEFVRCEIKDAKGAKYSTFDEKLYEIAEMFKGRGQLVILAYNVSKFGNDLTAITEAPSQPVD